MTRYEKLIAEAENHGVEVLELDLGTNKRCGKYVNNTVIINMHMTDIEKHEVLEEELGHHFTTYGDITNQNKLENRKKELIARRWANRHCVTLIGLIEAFEYGAKDVYGISEFLGVTESQLLKSIEDYKKIHGMYYLNEEYIIYFEPYLYIGRKI